MRRRPYDWDAGPEYLAGALRREGRLALAVGDAAGAKCALAHHLVLRAGAAGGAAADSREARLAYRRLTPDAPAAAWRACARR